MTNPARAPRLSLALGGALALALSGGAHAQGAVEEQLTAVPRGDLDLSLPSAGRELYARIMGAAREVCTFPPAGISGGSQREREVCFRSAMQSAVDRLDDPLVTETHLQAYSWAAAPRTSESRRLIERRP